MSEETLLDGVSGIAEHIFPNSPKQDRKRLARQVQHWIDNHGLPVLRIGRRIYGRPPAIKDWLDQQASAALDAATASAGGPADD